MRDVLSAWLPALVAFVLVPVTVYLPNQREFEYDQMVLAPYMGLALVGFVVLMLCFPRMKSATRGRVAAICFFFGAYLALSDSLAPVQLGEMRRTISLEPVPEPASRDLLDAGLGLLALAGAIFVPIRLVRMAGPVVVSVLLLSEVFVIWQGLAESRLQKQRESLRAEVPTAPLKRPNVYHITFDGFSSLNFIEIMRRVASPEDFDGFTFYPENRANYLQTYVSVPSYTTGRFYEGGSLGKWIRDAEKENLMATLGEKGYEVWQYAASRSWLHASASHVFLARDFRNRDFAEECYFADLVALHLAPHYLHQEAFGVGSRGIVSRLLGRWIPANKHVAEPLRHVALLRELIESETTRESQGQYVYAHVFIPHPPYVLMPNCTFSAEATYEDQAGAAVTLMLEIIEAIRREGNYENSLILFHADHGNGEIGFQELADHGALDSVASRLGELGRQERFVPTEVLNTTRALLLVKPPGASGPLQIDHDRVTQLADLPATVYALLNLDVKTAAGQPLVTSSPDRTIHIYRGFSRANEFGVNMRYGVRIFEGFANHFSYHPVRGMQIHDDIAVKW
jgi:hypothetical protein